MAGPDVVGEIGFESGHLLAENEGALADHPLEGPAQIGLDCGVLPIQPGEGDLLGENG